MPNSQRPPDKTRRFRLSCLVCRCELDDCFERVQTSNFLSATVLSCRESNSHCRNGRGTDKTVLSCLAWRCELVLKAGIHAVLQRSNRRTFFRCQSQNTVQRMSVTCACRCCKCSGDGRVVCPTCQGYRNLKCFIKLRVE